MRTLLTWTGIILAGALALWLLLHVLISPVNPAQEAPSGHPSAGCWACHFVSESAQIEEF
jgi:hypothetical protein